MSLEDARTLESGAVLRAKVCIVGAGAAGLTLASEFDGTGVDVLLLESGGEEVDARTTRLYQGTTYRGPEKAAKPRYLTGTRLRYFGGTTNHWDGACAPFEAHDFEGSSWHPLVGWPIDADEMAPFYKRAAPIADVAPFDYGLEELAARDRPVYELPPASGLVYRHFQISSGKRFGPRFRELVDRSENVRLWQWANLVDMRLDEGGSGVQSLSCQTLSGVAFTVEADVVVMACGGVENARILLNCRSQVPTGIGNERDVLGRYFMDHPSYSTLRGSFFGSLPHMKAYERKADDVHGHTAFNVFSIAPDLRADLQILDANFRISRDRSPAKRKPRRGREYEDDTATQLAQVEAEEVAAAASILGGAGTPQHGYAAKIRLVVEAEPHEGNRVQLVDELDELGLRRVRLDWSLTELDRRTIDLTTDWFARNLALHIPARVAADPLPEFSSYQCHHAGTARMGDDPRTSVVDADSRVHGLRNLYIAGSATFPTLTAVNPTFSIVAFAIRLADHLRAQLDK